MRTTFIIIICAAIGLVSGCGGGHRRYDIATGGDGGLRTVRSVPVDGMSNVSTLTWVRIYWPPACEPPPTFRFDLRDGDNTRIATIMHRGDGFEWYFEPADELDHSTKYTAELFSGNEKMCIIFMTDEDINASSRAAYPGAGAGAAVSGPMLEHTITR